MPKILGTKYGGYSGGYSMEKLRTMILSRRKYSMTYIVLGDTRDDTDIVILNSTDDLPKLWEVLDGATCISAKAEEIEIVVHPVTGSMCGLWEVQCEFDSYIDAVTGGGSGDPENPTNPKDLRPVVKWNGEIYEYSDVKDIAGDATLTTANELVVVSLDSADPILTIERYEEFPFNPSTILGYVNRTNRTAFYGAPIGTALMLPIQTTPEDIDGTRYEHVTYTIKFRLKYASLDSEALVANTFLYGEFLNYGYYHLEHPTPEEDVRVLTVDPTSGHPIQTRIDAFGAILAENGDPIWITYLRHFTAEFNDLNLGPY